MGIWRKIWRFIRTMTIFGVLVVLSVFTPIFANIGVLGLDLFSKITLKTHQNPPIANVVLGGGLTRQQEQIILNHYSQSRADQAISLHTQNALPIVTSGAESPWLQEYIKTIQPSAIIISENASLNTCENATFTAKLLTHHELPQSVHLITDRYHMARARRQFAKAGVATMPKPASLAIPLSWRTPKNNLVHSRRVVYEVVALARDIFRPQKNCRTADEISLEEISTPRRQPKVFSSIKHDKK